MSKEYDFPDLELTNIIVDNPYVLECQPYEYFFFKIPEECYAGLSGINLDIELVSGSARLVLNEYLPSQPFLISASGKVYFDITNCEQGENILAYKGQLRIRRIELLEAAHREKNISCARTLQPIADPEEAAAEFLLSSRILAPQRSQFRGSCYAIYDYTNSCHRMSCWLWSDAPVVSALLQMAEGGTITEKTEEYIKAAKEIGEVFLNSQVKDPHDEAYGALISRYRYYGRTERSFHKLMGLNDTSYSVKWALLPLFQYTGDDRYLHAAGIALDWVEKNIYGMGFVPSHYYYEDKIWENRAFVDTGFCAEGFEQYQLIVKDRDYSQTIDYLMQRFLRQFRLDNGFYGQNYAPETGSDNRLFTRGHAWVLEGILACYRKSREEQYRKEAEALCRKLAGVQLSDGSFSYLLGFGRPDPNIMKNSGICEKATAILAYLFLEYNRLSPDSEIQAAALKALSWCTENMEMEPGAGFGGIAAESLSSGITGLPFLKAATGYANAYYIMAKKLAKINFSC